MIDHDDHLLDLLQDNNLPQTGSSGVSTAPTAEFSGDPLSGGAPLDVDFTDESTNSPASWFWEKLSSDDESVWVPFEGTPLAQNPTESFGGGTWSIRLTAASAAGFSVEEKAEYIHVAS